MACSTALFSDMNRALARPSLCAIRCATSGGVNARTTGPAATPQNRASHSARWVFSLGAGMIAATRHAAIATITAAPIAALITKNPYEAAIGSLGGQIANPPNRPARLPQADASTKTSRFSSDKTVAIPVPRAIGAKESQGGKSRLGSMIAGHQQTTAAMTVRAIRSQSLRIISAKRTIAGSQHQSRLLIPWLSISQRTPPARLLPMDRNALRN